MLAQLNSKSLMNDDVLINNKPMVSSGSEVSFGSDRNERKMSVVCKSDSMAGIQQEVRELVSDLLIKVGNVSDPFDAVAPQSTINPEVNEGNIKLLSKSMLDILFYTENYIQRTQPAAPDNLWDGLLNTEVDDIGYVNSDTNAEDNDIMMVSLNNYLLFDDIDHDTLNYESNSSLMSNSSVNGIRDETNVISGKHIPSILVKSTLLQIYNNYLQAKYGCARRITSWPDIVQKLYKIQIKNSSKRLHYIENEIVKTEMDLKDANAESSHYKRRIEDLKRIIEGNSLTKRIESIVLKQDTRISLLKSQLELTQELYSIYKRRMTKVRAEMSNLKRSLVTEKNDLVLLRKKSGSIKAEIKTLNKNHHFQVLQIKNAAMLNELSMTEHFRHDLSKAIRLIRQEFEIKLRIKKDALDSNYRTVWDVLFHKMNRLYKTPKLSQIMEIISLKTDIEIVKKECTRTRKRNKNLLTRINQIFAAIGSLDYNTETKQTKEDGKILLNRKLEDLKEKEIKVMEENASLREELDRLRHLVRIKSHDQTSKKITTSLFTSLSSANTKVIKSSLKNSQPGKHLLRKNVKFFPVVFQRYISINTVPALRNNELLRLQLS